MVLDSEIETLALCILPDETTGTVLSICELPCSEAVGEIDDPVPCMVDPDSEPAEDMVAVWLTVRLLPSSDKVTLSLFCATVVEAGGSVVDGDPSELASSEVEREGKELT